MSVPARPLIADWPLTVCRYFLVDGDAGDDTAKGYLDAAPLTTIVPGANPKKTIAAAMAIIPQLGMGRSAVLMIKTKAAAASYGEAINLPGVTGYAFFMIRGSTDLTNTTTDQLQAGARQVQAGTGGGGAFTVAAGSSTSVLNLGGGDTIPAEPAALQYRIRFDPATATVALRNICKVITSHTTTALTVGSNLGTAPAVGDKFYIEGPGVTVTGGKIDGPVIGRGAIGATQSPLSMAGIRFTSTTTRGVQFSLCNINVTFCEGNGATNNVVFNFSDCYEAGLQNFVVYEDIATLRTLGMGLRTTTLLEMRRMGCPTISCSGFMNTSTAQPYLEMFGEGTFLGDQCYFAHGIRIDAMGCASGTANASAISVFFGRNPALSASNRQPRINGAGVGGTAGVIVSGSIGISGVDFQNLGGLPAIKAAVGRGGYSIEVDGCTGSTGNTDVGIDISGATRLVCSFGRNVANTVTGNAGDIRVAGSVITTHAGLSTTNLVDTARNTVIGTAGATVVDQCLQLNNGEGAPMAIGDLVRVSAANTVVLAQADTAPHSSGPLLVAVTPPAAAAAGLFYRPHQAWIHHDGAPTQSAISYVSVGTAGRATTTVPPVAATNQKRRLGCVVAVSGNNGLVVGSDDNLPVVADGLA